MKYSAGEIVLLNDGRTVYVFGVDDKAGLYTVFKTADEDRTSGFQVAESDISSLVLG